MFVLAKWLGLYLYSIPVTNACTSVVYFLTYTLPMMCLIIALYHAWPTLRGRLASGLSTRPSVPISLRTSPLHG